MNAIRAEALTKSYGGDRGIVDIDFEVAKGEVFGFVGPNGAGKTTTIRLLLDLIRPTSGRVTVLGADPRRDVDLRRRIGYLPGDLRLYDGLTGRELLGYFAALRRLRGLGTAPALAEALGAELDRPVGSLSKGNRQKIGVLQAFMHEPELLVLDEPTAGLDPIVQQAFLQLVRDVRQRGATVFLSSHVLSEVQHMADRVALVREGRLLTVAAVEDLRRRTPTRVAATFAGPVPPLAAIPGAQETARHDHSVEFRLTGEIDPLLKELARHHVIRLESHEPDLEDVFLELYDEAADAR